MGLLQKLFSIPFKTILKNNVNNIRSLSTTIPVQIKEIQIIQEKNAIVVQGVSLPSLQSGNLLNGYGKKFCPECTLGLKIKHTDVLILSQYVRSDGCMLPRRITGLCRRQQRCISAMVTMAHKAGLMPNLAPKNSKRNPKQRYQWKKYNKYFNESTIKSYKLKDL